MTKQTPETMTPIETNEIRGLSLRTLITLVVCTITIVSTVVGTYYSLQNDIRELRIQKASDEKYTELRMRTIEVRISAVELQLQKFADKQFEPQATK